MRYCHTQFLYRLYAPIYDLCLGRLFKDGHCKAISYLPLSSTSVLDIGVGTGLSLSCYSPCHQVTAIDASDAMLSRARKRVEKSGMEGVVIAQMNAECLEYPRRSFDSVLLCYVLSVVSSPRKVLREACRVCKPGGSLIVVNHSVRRRGVLGVLERAVSPLALLLGFRSSMDVRNLLVESADLELVETSRANAFGYWDVYHCKRRKS